MMWNGSRDAWANWCVCTPDEDCPKHAADKQKIRERIGTFRAIDGDVWVTPGRQHGCTVTAKHGFGTPAGDYLFIPGDCGGPEPGTIDLSDDGLPPLAEGSRINVGGDVVGQNVVSCILELSSCSVVSSEGTRLPKVQDIRHLIARHDRERGRYWADRLRKLKSEMHMRSMSATFTEDPLKARHDAYADAAQTVERLLADLRAKGVC